MSPNEKIKAIRESKALSRDALSRLSGITPLTIFNIEHNKTDPRLSSLVKIAAALEIQLSDLF